MKTFKKPRGNSKPRKTTLFAIFVATALKGVGK